MITKGFVLILCLCFIGLISCTALSVLAISELNHQITNQTKSQLQRQLSRAAVYQQHLIQQAPLSQHWVRVMPACPAEYAVWQHPQNHCELIWLPAANDAQGPGLGSLLIRWQLSGLQPKEQP